MSHTVSSQTTSYIWDAAADLPAVLQDGTNSYVYGLNLISATDGSAAQTYFLYDGLGSTTGLTDGSGNNSVSYSYDVFGAVRSQSGTSNNYWLFSGEQRDGDSSLYYLRARYYDPSTGRFISQDPISADHPFVYVNNNPVTATDPYGLFCIGPDEVCNVVKDAIDKTEDFALKPWNDAQDTIQNINTLANHPSSAIQQLAGLAVARGSFGDRVETDGAVFYTECWGLCSAFRLIPQARNITIGHFVFSQGNPGPVTMKHELRHVHDSDREGFLWTYKYFKDLIENGYRCSKFEEDARKAAGQPSQCTPYE